MRQSEHFPDSFYRVSIRGLVRKENKFLLGYHTRGQIWETFGGGLDFGEDMRDALRREIKEETGCDVTYISEEPIMILPHIVHGHRDMEWFYNLPIYFAVEFDHMRLDTSLQYSEARFFTVDEMQELNIFEGEEGLKEELRKFIE